MFAPDQQKAASELARVCKPSGKIGLANWTPDGFVGQMIGIALLDHIVFNRSDYFSFLEGGRQ